ncbi:hypothetical protein PROFUN_02632 [Planoprotostelium fungivorum]|uniref:Uncharacterized protein n=1 Tax=Planoprotostelium fungivorum TaxID=1890364 RepID=A0A2P6NVA4_9EUKA|nr:hypothetical protein PROFUN_02632 [Planoprotostelium fungivorum]
MQQAYNKYLAANAKVNNLTRQQQSKQVSWLMNKPKKQFLECVAKPTPPEYLAANTKVNDLTRQQQSKQVSWLMNKPKKQFLGCVAKHTPPEVFQKCVEQYDDPDAKYEQYKIIPYSGLRNSAYEKELNAGHTNRAAVLRPPPGMKIQHLPKGIREYYYKQVSKEGDWSRCKRQNQKKDSTSCRGYR